MSPKYAKNRRTVLPDVPPAESDPIPFGSREDQVERRHPGADAQPSIAERRKTDEVGGED
jgi:hypothetical protein